MGETVVGLLSSRFNYFLFIIIFSCFDCALFHKSLVNEVKFDYSAISNNYFTPNQSKPFPLTVQRGNSLYNSTTNDGRYLFYTSDQKGNFDIYFRDLQSSLVVPVTNHPYSESKPSISPNGNFLLFVSEEFDSEGDIVLLEMDLEEWKSEYLRGKRFIGEDFANLTNPDAERNSLGRGVLDTDPIWAPDNETIYFISDRFTPGVPNLCKLNRKKPKEISLITKNGATSPSISPNGNTIYYISFFENNKGEIYSLNLNDSKITRHTDNQFLDFTPTVDGSEKNLYYASIRKDTNKNGYLDERDNSVLVMKNLQTGKERILSSGETSNFDVRYSNFNGGSILFSASYYNSINIYFIPENGSIPKQQNISEQYQYAKNFSQNQSLESYFLALDSVELFYSSDPLFPIYNSRVKLLKYITYRQAGKKEEATSIALSISKSKESGQTIFEKILLDWEVTKEKGTVFDFENNYSRTGKYETPLDVLPSLLHLRADELEISKNHKQSLTILTQLYDQFPNYHQIDEIKRRIGGYEFRSNSKHLPNMYLSMIEDWEVEKNQFLLSPTKEFSAARKRDLRFLLEDVCVKLEENRNSNQIILYVDELKKYPENDNKIFNLTLDFLKAKAFTEQRRFDESNQILDSIIPIPTNIDLEPPGKKSVFETPQFIAEYKNPILLRANLLKYQNQKMVGNTSDALRNLKIYLEFYDPILGVDLNTEDIQNAFFYFENKAIEFERIGDLLQSSFHYFFNNQNMFLVKTRNLFLESLYKDYAIYYQRRMVDTIFRYGKKLREEEERALISQLNVLSKDKLNLVGNLSNITSLATNNEIMRGLVDIKDFEKIEILSEKALGWTELYYKQAVPRARPYLDLATLYGYAYFLINKYVIYESYYYSTNTMTDSRKREILENYKRAESELRWIIFADPTYYDAYQLLGWLYQYVDLIKEQKLAGSEKKDIQIYEDIYANYFPDKNLEGNIELYNQILVFLGENYENKKVISDLNLNLGNNYFLLNNYPKANESYEAVKLVSSKLVAKYQFDDYRQEAIYKFNFGKSLIFQGKYAKASEQFSKAIDIYFKNEYFQSVNQYVSEPNDYTKSKLSSIKSKLTLLFSLKGLTELEDGNFSEATSSFQTAIAYNRDVKYISPISLNNFLAISLQKAGRFRDSYAALDQAEAEYKSLSETFWSRWEKVSIISLLINDDIFVNGEGRFPGEFPNKFKYLLTLGVRIENHIEQQEYDSALKEIKVRNEFISDNSLHKSITGKSILTKSDQIQAQVFLQSGRYSEAVSTFESLVKLLLKEGDEKSLEKSFLSFGHAVFTLIESGDDSTENKIKTLEYYLNQLEVWRSKYVCVEEKQICETNFRIAYVNYDVLKGLGLYYLGNLKEEIGGTSFNHYIEAAELLENPGLIDPTIIGLQNDPFTKENRVRILLNLYTIYSKIGDHELAEKRWREANELTYEFRMDSEMFWSKAIKFIRENERNSIQKKNNISQIANESFAIWKDNLPVRLFGNERRIKIYLNEYSNFLINKRDYNGLINLWENFRSLSLFRDATNAQFEFEDSKLNLAYRDLLDWHRKYKKLRKVISEKAARRENLLSSIDAFNKENKNLIERLKTMKSISEDKAKFLEPARGFSSSYPQNWFGLYKSKNESFLISEKSGKLSELSCDLQSTNPDCLVRSNSDHVFIQLLGNEIDGNLVAKYLQLFRKTNQKVAIVFDREHSVIFPEKNERKLKWITQFGGSENDVSKLKNLHITNDNLGTLIYETDLLITQNKMHEKGNVFSDPTTQTLPLREIFTVTGSEISLVGLPMDVFSTKYQWNQISKIFEVLRSKRIQNLVSFSPQIESSLSAGTIELEKLAVLDNHYFVGNWNENASGKVLSQSQLLLLLREGFEKEKTKEYNEAYQSYYTASTLLDDEHPELPKIELKLAKLKAEIYPNIPRITFFRPLLEKYKSKTFQNQIQYEYLVACYSAKEKENCLKQNFIGSDKENYEKSILFYEKIRNGKLSNIEQNSYARKELEKDEDPFLQSYRLGSFYIQNYLLEEADLELNKLGKFAKTTKEKNVVKNRELEILFHKGFLFGNGEIDLTELTSTSAYSLGFRKNWQEYDDKILSREFTKYGYSDSIYDQYRIKLYQSWKEKIQFGYFDPLSLTPEYLTTGDSVLTKLSHLNRTLLFSLLSNSIRYQRKDEVNSLIELLLDEERREGRSYRILFFKMIQAEKYLIRGETERTQKMLADIDSEIKKIGNGNAYFETKLNELRIKVLSLTNKNLKNEFNGFFADLYKQTNTAKPEDFLTLLNDFNRKHKNVYVSQEVKDEYEILFAHLLNLSLNKNSSESFFDLAMARETIRYTSSRYLGRPSYIRDFPLFLAYSESLKKKMIGNQEFNGIFDLGKKTYLLSFVNGKSLGRELFADNKELNQEIIKYLQSINLGGQNTLLRDSLSDRYRTNLRLSKTNRHYLYTTGLHSTVPINLPDFEYYYVGSVAAFLTNKPIRMESLALKKPEVGAVGFDSDMESLVIADLMIWETGGKKSISSQINLDFTKIHWENQNYIKLGSSPIATTQRTKKKYINLYAKQNLLPLTNYCSDLDSVSYYLAEENESVFVLHSGSQSGIHNLFFMKKILEGSELPKPIHIRWFEGRDAARTQSLEDKDWVGYKLFTSAIIEN
ncbi:biopolymer transporter TolR [Leptospira sp. 96542]|nr:biopolymer transporter TolR [Leptospira sp. 96542]